MERTAIVLLTITSSISSRPAFCRGSRLHAREHAISQLRVRTNREGIPTTRMTYLFEMKDFLQRPGDLQERGALARKVPTQQQIGEASGNTV